MSTNATAAEQPPSYEDAADPKEVVEPTILVLAGQSIHAESADSTPLYQMNRSIASLSHATTQVEFERVERNVNPDAMGAPLIKLRPRQIYDLKYIPGLPLQSMPSDSPHYFVKSVSRRTLGDIGLKKSRFRSHWKALPVDPLGKKSDFGLPQFIKDARPLFEIRHKSDTYEWSDSGGNAIAVEDEGEGQHRLIVTASLHRESLDALVALWCCRLWQYSADHTQKIHDGREGLKRKLRLANS